MTRVKPWVGTSLALVLLLPVACSSSSSGTNPGSNGDGGSSADASNVISPLSDSGGVGIVSATCGQLAAVSGGTATPCLQGQTCCTTFSLGAFTASSSCVPNGQCSGGIANECQSMTDCTGGEVCCAGAAPSDASVEGGGGGGLAGFNPAALGTTCQASCEPGQQQQCASDGECPNGQVCRTVGGGGAFAAAGGGAATKDCAAPLPEAGAFEAGAGSGAGEAGAGIEAGAGGGAGDASAE